MAGTAGATQAVSFERVSIELTNRCTKACWFCYNHSLPEGDTRWTPDEVVSFVNDCADHGTRAVSFGGGEPLQYPGLFDVLTRLRGRLFRSLTSNGLLLTGDLLERLVESAPEKVHLSIHFPQRQQEVERVIGQVQELEKRGIKSGINFLVAQSNLEAAIEAARRVRAGRHRQRANRLLTAPEPRYANAPGNRPGGRQHGVPVDDVPAGVWS